MDAWIAFSRGPLFRIALAICVLGLAYRFFNSLWQVRRAWNQAGDRRMDGGLVVRSTFEAMMPVRLFKVRPLMTLASIAFHAGILLVPLFYVGHVTLWNRVVTIPWPVLGPRVSDVLTLVAIAGLVLVLLTRLLVRRGRDLTGFQDVFVLVLLLGVMASGYWASHPTSSPFDPRGMLLVHALAGNLALVLTPMTKFVHCILAPLTQLLSEVAWHFPADGGRKVAAALGKENEPV